MRYALYYQALLLFLRGGCSAYFAHVAVFFPIIMFLYKKVDIFRRLLSHNITNSLIFSPWIEKPTITSI